MNHLPSIHFERLPWLLVLGLAGICSSFSFPKARHSPPRLVDFFFRAENIHPMQGNCAIYFCPFWVAIFSTSLVLFPCGSSSSRLGFFKFWQWINFFILAPENYPPLVFFPTKKRAHKIWLHCLDFPNLGLPILPGHQSRMTFRMRQSKTCTACTPRCCRRRWRSVPTTVIPFDGSEIRRSPVEVGSLSQYFTGFFTSQVVVWDFWTINSSNNNINRRWWWWWWWWWWCWCWCWCWRQQSARVVAIKNMMTVMKRKVPFINSPRKGLTKLTKQPIWYFTPSIPWKGLELHPLGPWVSPDFGGIGDLVSAMNMFLVVWITPPKFDMEPENDGFQKESPFPGTSFQVPC